METIRHSPDRTSHETSGETRIDLRPIHTAEDVSLVSGWLSCEENYKWLDFGDGVHGLSEPLLRIMIQKGTHFLRLYSASQGGTAIGLVAFSNLHQTFKTATLWYVLGDKSHGGLGETRAAVSRLLQFGFQDLRLRAINAWAIEENRPSIRILERNGFRNAGRLRECHSLNGRFVDRLLFDLLCSEYEARNFSA
jgi:RimJ/RimL family protein N-acetyltransferase